MAMLIGFEAKGIQSWIISGGKLKDIAGGSDLIETISHQFRIKALDACGCPAEEQDRWVRVLSAGAGAFRLVIDDDALARRLVCLLPLMIAEWAPGLRYGLASCRLADGQPSSEEFDGFQSALKADGSLAGPLLPPATPFMLRAQRTGEPAVQEYLHSDDGLQGSEAADASMCRRRQAAASGNGASVFKRRLFPEMAGDFANDVDVIVGEGGYLAVLHADGNGLGQLFMKIGRADMDPSRRTELLSELSKAVGEATEEAVREASCAAVPDIVTGTEGVPLRPIVVGGDDVTILLPARQALPFAKTFLTGFGTKTAERLLNLKDQYAEMPGRLTACAGIAFVKPHYPFDQALSLAESLCKFAKARSRRDGHTLSSLAFHRVTTTLARDFETDIVDQDFTMKIEEERRLLTMAPYRVPAGDGGGAKRPPLADLDDLLRLEEVVHRLPRGAWRELAGLVRENDLLAVARYRRLCEVIPGGQTADLETALRQLGCALPHMWTSPPGTAKDGPPARSPILDVTALLAATGRGKGAGVAEEERA